ncbi:MAG: hypothetical protein K0Q87_1902 [Neobacillus sp.]|nr:hypothetical protein [Neobacillus sp.]
MIFRTGGKKVDEMHRDSQSTGTGESTASLTNRLAYPVRDNQNI